GAGAVSGRARSRSCQQRNRQVPRVGALVGRRPRAAILAVALVTAAALATTARPQASPLTIYAAASLTDVFQAYDPAEKYSFAGSNTLETQIRNGPPPPLFPSAPPPTTPPPYRHA